MENIVYKYFDVSSSQKSKIDLMLNVYSFWNDKINLISRKDFSYFYERHVLHSLSIAKVFDFVDDTKIMDLGTCIMDYRAYECSAGCQSSLFWRPWPG